MNRYWGELEMSNTQQEFRRQMKELEKEKKSEWIREKVYNNAIESYEYHYYDKNKRLVKVERKGIFFLKRIGGSLGAGALILLLWNSYALFTWVRAFFVYLMNKF